VGRLQIEGSDHPSALTFSHLYTNEYEILDDDMTVRYWSAIENFASKCAMNFAKFRAVNSSNLRESCNPPSADPTGSRKRRRDSSTRLPDRGIAKRLSRDRASPERPAACGAARRSEHAPHVECEFAPW
jgi:hypothetical protein